MIIENTGLVGLQAELQYLDDVGEQLGFVRWQWEYYRATYDLKLTDRTTSNDYFLRINTRAVEGKLENPHAVLAIEAVYIGKATFPHGLDYEVTIPQSILDTAKQHLAQLENLLK